MCKLKLPILASNPKSSNHTQNSLHVTDPNRRRLATWPSARHFGARFTCEGANCAHIQHVYVLNGKTHPLPLVRTPARLLVAMDTGLVESGVRAGEARHGRRAVHVSEGREASRRSSTYLCCRCALAGFLF